MSGTPRSYVNRTALPAATYLKEAMNQLLELLEVEVYSRVYAAAFSRHYAETPDSAAQHAAFEADAAVNGLRLVRPELFVIEKLD